VFHTLCAILLLGLLTAPAVRAADADKSASATQPPIVVHTADGKYEISVDTSNAPQLRSWAQEKLIPVMLKWYPKIVQMLPSDGFTAPRKFTVEFRDRMRNPAATGGTRIMCSAKWMEQNKDGEAVGAVVHEMVHVVQQYGNRRRRTPDAQPNPGWLVEGIPDYIRWFKYEPEKHGADIRNPDRAKYDASYRVSANFLNFVTDHADKEIVPQLNVAMRQGKYSEDLWKKLTGKTVQELADEWKKSLEKH
jgi:hypothetical protein